MERSPDASRRAEAALQPFQVTVPMPPLDAVGVTYFSSSLFATTISRCCPARPVRNVARSTLNVSVLPARSSAKVPSMAMLLPNHSPVLLLCPASPVVGDKL